MVLVALAERLAADLFVPPLAVFQALAPGVHEGVLDPPDPSGIIGVEVTVVEVGLVGPGCLFRGRFAVFFAGVRFGFFRALFSRRVLRGARFCCAVVVAGRRLLFARGVFGLSRALFRSTLGRRLLRGARRVVAGRRLLFAGSRFRFCRPLIARAGFRLRRALFGGVLSVWLLAGARLLRAGFRLH
ncbi:hypothetical protein [Amycolatopsis eburnea]|uniref:Uncharacterized protein n=1 Tax=Amycolatopsis eburnea TaxID=2267691 RepID=A0A427TCF1_9PSEU|nr:hypothetical protein [Amycolatopsis eburnea]RSD20067.1 hypothetical protein EIY87_17785 [Amycolatopsis eburnea]